MIKHYVYNKQINIIYFSLNSSGVPLSGNAADIASNIAILGNGLPSLPNFGNTTFGSNKLCCSLSSSC